jgi:hypothetical protein
MLKKECGEPGFTARLAVERARLRPDRRTAWRGAGKATAGSAPLGEDERCHHRVSEGQAPERSTVFHKMSVYFARGENHSLKR